MQWVCNIALFLVLSGILLEMIADTKYYKFARWVAGVVLLLQFLKPLTETEGMWNRFTAAFWSFDYALGTDRVLEDIYQVNGQAENSVLAVYKENVSLQIKEILKNNGLVLEAAEMEVEDNGKLNYLEVWARYQDKQESELIQIPTVAPVSLSERPKKETVSPLELYIRETLAEFYQVDENKIEVVIQEAE